MVRLNFTVLFLLLSSIVFSQENIQWRGTHRNGIYPDKNLLEKWPENGPKLLWHTEVLGAGHSSAAVTEDIVYTSGTEDENGFVIAFDHQGNQLWKKVYGKEWMNSYGGVRTTPCINDGMIYLMSGYGVLYALKHENGDLVWKKDLLNDFDASNIRWGVTENILIDGDQLFCTPGGEENNILSLNKKSGEIIWKSKGKGEKSSYCSPLLVEMKNRKLLVTHTQKSILGIDSKTGNLLWSVDHPNRYSIHPNTPIYKDQNLYCFSGYGKGGVMLHFSEDGSTVEEIWRDENLDNQMGGAVLLDGKIYGSGHSNREWFCLDWKTGEKMFSSKMMSKGNIIAADGKLYCYGDNGEIALVDIQNNKFEKLSSFRVPYGEKQHWAHLVIHNQRLYVRHGSALMVYSIKAN